MLSKKIKSVICKTLSFALVLASIISMPAYAADSSVSVTEQKTLTRQVEVMDRGLVAVKTDGGVYAGWRLLATEPESISFNLYRDGKKVNTDPVKTTTSYVDDKGTAESKYYVCAVLDGKEQAPSETVAVLKDQYLSIPLNKPEGGTSPDGSTYTYKANDCSVADLDGDGKYEMIVKWDPTNSQDNSIDGMTGNVLIDAYKFDGTFMWRIDLGVNIRAGAHYTQFMVYDLDGDGKAEIAFKTADGTVDGKGTVIGDASADYRMYKGRANSDKGPMSGRVLAGPEYLSVFEGATGKVLDTVNYDPSRGSDSPDEQKAMWGDNYGNRVDRFLSAVAFLDGNKPSLVLGRGYYTRLTIAAWDFRDGKLAERWFFDSNTPGNEKFVNQGNHNLSIADVDKDGKDEVIYGSSAVDDNGSALYTTGLGHGDAMHVGDLDPDHPGLEVAQVHEDSKKNKDIPEMEIHDAATGEVLWGTPSVGKDNGRGLAANVDPYHKGDEFWSSIAGLYDAKGNLICNEKPSSTNFAIYWDGDLTRELFDHIYDSKAAEGTPKIDKWDYKNKKTVNLLTAEGTATNNTTKGNPCLQADILGDWREEVVLRSTDSTELRIYTTTIPTSHRLYTLMSDPVYRLGVAWQNTAYNQPPHASYYIGEDSTNPIPGESSKPALPKGFTALKSGSCRVLEDGKLETIDPYNYKVQPFVVNKNAIVPVRFLSEKYGAKVEWSEVKKAVVVTLGDKKLEVTVDSCKVLINGKEKEISSPVQMVNDRLIMPLEALNEVLGKSVYIDEKGVIVLSETPQKFDTDSAKLMLQQVAEALN